MSNFQTEIIPVDQNAYECFVYLGTEEKKARNEATGKLEQALTADGVPRWFVKVQTIRKGTGETKEIRVIINAAEKPSYKLLTLLKFSNLQARTYKTGSNEQPIFGVSYSADGVEPMRRQ